MSNEEEIAGTEGSSPEVVGVPVDELSEEQQAAVAIMAEVCVASGLETEAVLSGVDGSYMHFNLSGDQAARAFGKHGRSLDALQVLCNLVVAHRTRSDLKISLDAGGYRARREQALIQRALTVAQEVQRRNEEAEFEPLPASERRIIHNALVNEPGVRTYSEGAEPDRRIIIAPAGAGEGDGEDE